MKKKTILLALGATLCTMLNAQTVAPDPAAAEQQATADNTIIDSIEVKQPFVADPQQPENYLRLYIKAGYAASLDNLGINNKNGAADLSNRIILGGPGAGIGFGYDFEYKVFRLNTGIEFNYLRSTSKYAFDINRDMTITQGSTNIPMKYNYRFGYLKETRNLMHIGVPVLVGAQFNKFFFMVGARAGYNLYANATTSGNYDLTAFDPTLIQTLGNDPALGLQLYDLNPTKHKIDLKQPELSVLAEVGLDLDEWLQYKPKKKRKGRNVKPTFKESLHYKVSLFAEYSVLNQNATAADNNLAKFNGSNVPISEVNTVLAMPATNGTPAMNNLFAGIKFAVQYQLPHKQPVTPPVRKPRVVTERQERTRQEVKATLKGMVYNIETQLPLKADVILTDSTGQQVFSGPSDSIKGLFTTNLPAGRYHAVVNKQGYLPYEEDVVFTLEALTFYIQPVKKGNTYVLRNLYFDTNSTTIQKRSEKSLNELFQFLNENKEVRIKLVGHTDSVGKDEDNQILSEGRATSVREAMIERGIEQERIEAEGRGESEPIDTNDTEEGRQRNRRVMVEIL